MKPKTFLQKKLELNTKLEAFKEVINEEYTALVNQFIKENTDVVQNKVYEVIGKPRKHYKRFVTYTVEVFLISGHVMIRCGGWWLDQFSMPKKWDTLAVFGVSNPTELVLSKNQNHLPHPDSIGSTDPKIKI